MTNVLSFWLGSAILVFLAVDFAVYGWEMSLFLGQKLLALIEYMAFWR